MSGQQPVDVGPHSCWVNTVRPHLSLTPATPSTGSDRCRTGLVTRVDLVYFIQPVAFQEWCTEGRITAWAWKPITPTEQGDRTDCRGQAASETELDVLRDELRKQTRLAAPPGIGVRRNPAMLHRCASRHQSLGPPLPRRRGGRHVAAIALIRRGALLIAERSAS